MNESQKTIDRIQKLLQRTEANGASESEEITASIMVCKLLRQNPQLLRPVPTLHDIELDRHQRAASRPQPPNWGYGFNSNTASGTGDIDDIRDFVRGLHKPAGYVTVRYNKLIQQNSTEVQLLVETNNGWEEIWLPLNKLKMKTRVIWIDEDTAREHNLSIR